MQISQGANNVTQNSEVDPITGFAQVGDDVSTVLLTIDQTGHIVLAEDVPIRNLPNGPINLSGNASDVVDGTGQSVPAAQLAANVLAELLILKDGTLPYTKSGDILVGKSA